MISASACPDKTPVTRSKRAANRLTALPPSPTVLQDDNDGVSRIRPSANDLRKAKRASGPRPTRDTSKALSDPAEFFNLASRKSAHPAKSVAPKTRNSTTIDEQDQKNKLVTAATLKRKRKCILIALCIAEANSTFQFQTRLKAWFLKHALDG